MQKFNYSDIREFLNKYAYSTRRSSESYLNELYGLRISYNIDEPLAKLYERAIIGKSTSTAKTIKSVFENFEKFLNEKYQVQEPTIQEPTIQEPTIQEPAIQEPTNQTLNTDEFLKIVLNQAKLSKPNKAFSDQSVKAFDFVPKKNPNYTYLEGEKELILANFLNNISMWVYGGAGAGKSTVFQQVAYDLKCPIIRTSINSEIEVNDLYFTKSFDGHKVIYHANSLVKAFEIANQIGFCIVMLEELNTGSAGVLTAINNATDDIRLIDTEVGRIQLNDGCRILIVGTGNIGSSYNGTNDLNSALRSRFFPKNKEAPNDDFILNKIWNFPNVPLDFKKKILEISKQIRAKQQSGDLSEKAIFTVREPKQILSLYGLISIEQIKQGIIDRFYDNVDDQKVVSQIVREILQ